MNSEQNITKKQPLIAAIYARVSTERQEQQATIESQLDELKTRITEDENVLPPENIFVDDGWTGEMLQRPQLDAMRDAAQFGNFQVLYVYDRGRISRVFSHQELVLEEVSDRGIIFVSLHDFNAKTPEEKIYQGMQGLFAEYERVKIAERMRRGKMFKAKNGILINGSALYGWDYVKKTDTKPAHYKINDNQARVVRMVYEWVGIEGTSIGEVRKRLYDLKISPKKGKSDFWTRGPIVRMLRCESYVSGKIYYNKTEAVVAKKSLKNDKYKKIKRNSRKMRPKEEWISYNVTPIINDRDLFNRVQKILDDNKKYAKKNRKYDYLFSEKIRCDCGMKRAGDGCNNNGHYYYRCEERLHNFPAISRKCKIRGMNAQVLDSLLWNELKKQLTDSVLLRKHAEEWLEFQSKQMSNTKEQTRFYQEIEKINEEEKRYVKVYGEGAIDFEMLTGFMKDAKKRKMSCQKQLEHYEAKVMPQQIEIDVDELCEEAKAVLDQMDKSDNLIDKKQVIRDIIDTVIIKERSEVEVWANIPLTSTSTLKLGHEPISRHCRPTKRREKYAF